MGTSGVHDGAPPDPLAFVRTHTSLAVPPLTNDVHAPEMAG